MTATAATAGGQVVPNAPVTWVTTQGRARVTGSGTTVSLSGAQVGVDTVVATSGAVTARVPVTVSSQPGVATSLAFTAVRAVLAPGDSLLVLPTALDGNGQPVVSRLPQYVVQDPARVRVAADGSLVGLAAGRTRVTATLDQGSAALDVEVLAAGSLSFALGDTVLASGAKVRLAGPGVAEAVVTVAGAPAAIVTTAGGVEALVPPAPFLPCLPAGNQLALAVRVGGRQSAVALPAAELPVTVRLAAGEHALVSAALARGCAIETPDAGQYAVMPFTVDTLPEPYLSGWAAPAA